MRLLWDYRVDSTWSTWKGHDTDQERGYREAFCKVYEQGRDWRHHHRHHLSFGDEETETQRSAGSRSQILSPGSFFSLNALVVTKAWCREKLGLVMEGLVPVCLIWTHVCSFTSARTQSKSDAGKCSKNKNLLMGLMFQRDKWWYLILVSFFAFKRISWEFCQNRSLAAAYK